MLCVHGLVISGVYMYRRRTKHKRRPNCMP